MPQSENWPFQRLLVDHLFKGTTRVWWALADNFNDPAPHTFQLQASYAGTPNALDWIDIGTPAINAFYLDDDAAREQTGKLLLTQYRVVLTTSRAKYISGAQQIAGTLSTAEWNIAREMVRKEQLRAEAASRPGYLLKKMRYGVHSARNTDTLTSEIIDSAYPASWGTAFMVGYHPPVNVLADFSEKDIVERRGGGNPAEWSTRPTEYAVRFIAFPHIAIEDVWVDATTDERWIIGDIKIVAALRGVPLIYSARLSLVPFSDVIYRIPVTNLSADPTDESHFQPTTGTGCVRVDHDYPTNSNLVYQAGDCCGVEGATVLAFSKANWDLGNRVPSAAAASSQTTTNGTWAWAMLLDPGEYVLLFEKLGVYGPDTVALTVTVPDPGPPPSLSSIMSSEIVSDSSSAPAPPPDFVDEFGQF